MRPAGNSPIRPRGEARHVAQTPGNQRVFALWRRPSLTNCLHSVLAQRRVNKTIRCGKSCSQINLNVSIAPRKKPPCRRSTPWSPFSKKVWRGLAADFTPPYMVALMSTSKKSTAQDSDKSLLRQFRDGQNDAATELYVRYASRLLALAKNQTSSQLATRFDPEDVVQSVFRTFFRRASAGLYDVPAGEQLWQLLLVLALNKVRSLAVHHRAQKRDAGKTIPIEQLQLPSQREDGTPMQILAMVVDDLMAELTESQRQIVQLRMEGHTIGEIAERTGRSRRTAERVMQEFRHRLSVLIDGDQFENENENESNDESRDDRNQRNE